jgi:GT2 family glycosyltransferase
METPRTAVVILNWNGKSYLQAFLPSVVEHTPKDAQIIVADNASSDDSLEFLKNNYPEIRIITLSKNLGYAGGYNAALEQVNADYFVLLNSDMEVTPGWLEPVIALMESDARIAACQPVIRAYHQKTHYEYAGASGGFLDRYGYPFCRGRIFNTLEQDQGQYPDARDVFWATGACLFVRATAFREACGFDNRFFAHMEEIDLCWRLKNQGHRVMVCPRSTVYHVGGGTLPKSNPRKTYLNFRNSLWLMAKNMPAGPFYASMTIRKFLDWMAALKFLLSGHPADFFAVIKAYWAFLRTFRSMRAHSPKAGSPLPSLLYRRSIAWDYFLRQRRTFPELDHEKFLQ